MMCDDPGCTGRHAGRTDGLCPAARERRNASQRAWYAAHYQEEVKAKKAAYYVAHREEQNEKRKERSRKDLHTPGTYVYDRVHGIGVPGMGRRIQQNRRYWSNQRAIVMKELADLERENPWLTN